MNTSLITFYPFFFYAGLVLLLVALVLFRRAGHSWLHVFIFTVFWLYGMLMVSAALFPIPLVEMDTASAQREMGEVLARINWVPFHYGYHTLGRAVFYEVLFNFLLTVPAGLILPYLFKLRKRGFVIALLVNSLGFEVLQLSISLVVKVAYRVVDLSDVILNSSGFLFGYGLFWLCSCMLTRICRTIRF
jgi:glycopeptide antibiotics resistance protein